MPKIRKIITADFEKIIKESIFGAIWTVLPKFWGNQIFSEKPSSVTFLHLWFLNFMQKIRKILRADFEKIIKESIFEAIWTVLPKFWENQIFSEKSGSVTFLQLWSPNFMQKIRKILRAVSEI